MSGYSPAAVATGNIGINPEYAEKFWQDQIRGTAQQQPGNSIGGGLTNSNLSRSASQTQSIVDVANSTHVTSKDCLKITDQIIALLTGPSESPEPEGKAISQSLDETLSNTKSNLAGVHSRLLAIYTKLGGLRG